MVRLLTHIRISVGTPLVFVDCRWRTTTLIPTPSTTPATVPTGVLRYWQLFSPQVQSVLRMRCVGTSFMVVAKPQN
jgi:hypothetical protein